MGLVIYGQSKAIIGVDEVLVKCPSCQKDSWADLMVQSQFFHLYWIPIFPFDKAANLICQDCGLKRYGLPFNNRFIPTYHEIKHKFRHPFKTYAVALLLLILIVTAFVSTAFDSHT